jgi:hypothetical protein
MLVRISLGLAFLTMLSGIVFSALIVRGRNGDDGGFTIVLVGLVLVSTLLIAGAVARIGLSLRVEGKSRLD